VVPVPDIVPVSSSDGPPPLTFLQQVHSGLEWCFGLMCLPFFLAVLAAIPGLGLLSLGYLLEVAGRIGRTGKLRSGFIGVRQSARLGGIVFSIFLLVWPLWLVEDFARNGLDIDPTSQPTQVLQIGLLSARLFIGFHLILALACGGRMRYFFVPFLAIATFMIRLARGGYFQQSRDAVWEFVRPDRVWYYTWLSLRGFAGAFLWLLIPISMMALGRQYPLIGFPGSFVLMLVLMVLPFLQVHFAARGQMRAFLDVRGIVWRYFHAPWAFTLALVMTLAFALPLYALKIEMIPREAGWLPALVFIAFMFPARMLAGWAYACAEHRLKTRPLRFESVGRILAWLFFSSTGALVALPVVAIYTLIVFFTQYISWYGVWSLYEQHAFLLPVPFFGM
jgi:hypothetical protein